MVKGCKSLFTVDATQSSNNVTPQQVGRENNTHKSEMFRIESSEPIPFEGEKFNKSKAFSICVFTGKSNKLSSSDIDIPCSR